jgi:hypothetical protein
MLFPYFVGGRMWVRIRGNYTETPEVNCELEKRYELFLLRVRVNRKSGTTTTARFLCPKQTNPVAADRTALRILNVLFLLSLASPFFNINFFISLCFYLYFYSRTTVTLFVITFK